VQRDRGQVGAGDASAARTAVSAIPAPEAALRSPNHGCAVMAPGPREHRDVVDDDAMAALTPCRCRADNPAVAYDEDLANRIRELIAGEEQVVEKKMFGGLAFLVAGHMSVSVSGRGGLLLRVDPAQTESLLRTRHAQPAEMRGRTMDGWLRIDPEGVATKRQLERWVARGVSYARSLPPKRAQGSRQRARTGSDS
jgi:TfoX/Sxy family transcriptional regulator of competence genes